MLVKRHPDLDIESNKGPGLYWLVATDYERNRAIFQYLEESFAKLGILKVASKRLDPGQITLMDGTVIKTKSAKDPKTLVMEAPNGIIADEASQLEMETYLRMQSRCAPKKAWLFMAGTIESSYGWYVQLAQAWSANFGDERSFRLPSYSNLHLYPGGRNDPEILRLERASPDRFFMERIEGIPRPPQGLVFTEFRLDAHVREVELDESEDVDIAIDPGYAGAYSVLAIQRINDVPVIIDEIYAQNLVTEEVIQIAQEKPWWKNVHRGVIDAAGYQHQALAPVAEVWMNKTGLYLSSNTIKNVNDLDERLSTFLRVNPLTGEAGISISQKCVGLLSEFGVLPNPHSGQTQVYSWKVDNNGQLVGQTPANSHNHSIRALEYWLLENYGFARPQRQEKLLVRRF
jgi:SepF-like predicted cell division protein (DUF552 family)